MRVVGFLKRCENDAYTYHFGAIIVPCMVEETFEIPALGKREIETQLKMCPTSNLMRNIPASFQESA